MDVDHGLKVNHSRKKIQVLLLYEIRSRSLSNGSSQQHMKHDGR